jgi:plasmid replication initiation protein
LPVKAEGLDTLLLVGVQFIDVMMLRSGSWAKLLSRVLRSPYADGDALKRSHVCGIDMNVIPPVSRLDLFRAEYRDPPLRDIREAMVYPFVSLAKKRSAPIVFNSKALKIYLTGGPEFGLPTIWDWDLIIWLTSQLNEANEKGDERSRRVSFRPNQFFRMVGRQPSGRTYMELANSVRRLRNSTIFTCGECFEGCASEKPFSWISEYRIPSKKPVRESEAGNDSAWIVELPECLFSVISEQKSLLAIHPHYFRLKSGISRALYRLARKSVPNDKGFWPWRMDTLHQRLGIQRPLRSFARDVRLIAQRDDLPEFTLDVQEKRGHELVVFQVNPTKPLRPRRGVYHPDQRLPWDIA